MGLLKLNKKLQRLTKKYGKGAKYGGHKANEQGGLPGNGIIKFMENEDIIYYGPKKVV